MIRKQVTVAIPQDLESRPAALLVQLASRYESAIYIESEQKKINAKSIMGMMSLALDKGDSITLTADGTDEEIAGRDIEAYLSGRQA